MIRWCLLRHTYNWRAAEIRCTHIEIDLVAITSKWWTILEINQRGAAYMSSRQLRPLRTSSRTRCTTPCERWPIAVLVASKAGAVAQEGESSISDSAATLRRSMSFQKAHQAPSSQYPTSSSNGVVRSSEWSSYGGKPLPGRLSVLD